MSKTKIPFLISVLIIAVLMIASFVEPIAGSEATRRMFYGTWWFRILWAALATSGAWMCVHWRLWKKPAVALLHVSFLVILAGALATSLTSTEGSMMLYEGEQTDMFLTKDRRVAHMEFTLRLDSFRIDRYADNGEPSGFRSHVSIIDPNSSATSASSANDTAVISMNHILRYRRLRFSQASYTPDGAGTILTVIHDPYGIGITYSGYALLLLSAVLLLLPKRLKRPSTAAIVIGAVTLLGTAAYTLRWTSADHLLPVLRSPLLGVHIGVIVVAYLLFLIMALISAYSLIAHKSSTSGHLPLTSYHLPLTSYHLPLTSYLKTAVLFLSVGIFIGAVWAGISWGNYWTWDPKEVWALITLLIYCLPLHHRSLPWFKDERHLRWYLIFAFASVLITYFGVNLVLGGMHSYAT